MFHNINATMRGLENWTKSFYITVFFLPMNFHCCLVLHKNYYSQSCSYKHHLKMVSGILLYLKELKTEKNEHVIPITWQFVKMMSYWARWHLKSPASPLFAHPFVQAQIKENIKAPCHWPLGIPAQRASNVENVSIWWHHVLCITSTKYLC